MFSRIIRSYEPIFSFFRLYNKGTTKCQKYFYINLQFEHNNRRYFIISQSLPNQQHVKENLVEQCEKNKNDKNNNEKQCQSKQTNKHQSEEIHKEQNNEKSNNKKSQEKRSEKSIFGKELTLNNFEGTGKKEKDTFLECLRTYKSRPIARKDAVTFIKVAMKYMEEFGVHQDLESYKMLLDVFPKGTMIPTNVFQTFFMHYPREQYCAVALLDQMELNSVIPDVEMEKMLLNIFGRHGLPTAKYWKMMYWMPKFKNLNPWPVPKPIPNDAFELAKLAMIKISSIDVRSKITVFETDEVEDSIDKTWIVSAMAPKQNELLVKHKKETPIFVEGPFRIYVAIKAVDYFILTAKPPQNRKYPEYDPDAFDKIRNPYLEKGGDIILPPSIHEQVDATIFAVCATGTSSQDSLLSWIRCLQKENPVLGDIPIVFTLKNISQEKSYIENGKNSEILPSECKKNEDNELLQG